MVTVGGGGRMVGGGGLDEGWERMPRTRCFPKLLTRIRRGGRVVILIKMFLRFQ